MTAKDKKHQEFINQYFLCNMNQTEAYLKVYPKSSYDAARAHAARLVADGNIAADIAQRLKEKQMSADEVLARLGDMASASHADFTEVNLREDLKDHPKAHLVKTIVSDVYEDKLGKIHHKLRFELYDAQAALLNIGKQHGLFSDRHIIDMRLEKEIDSILDTLEGILPPELYSNVLAAISGPAAGGETSTESQSAEVE